MFENVAVYLRVSTEEQSKHWGVQAQLSSRKKYCRENKLAIAAVHTDIISGATSNRPGFPQMFVDAKQKSSSMIVVAELDRLARDLYLQIGTIEDLRGHGVGVVSVAGSAQSPIRPESQWYGPLAAFLCPWLRAAHGCFCIWNSQESQEQGVGSVQLRRTPGV